MNDDFLAKLKELFRNKKLKITLESESGWVTSPEMQRKLNAAASDVAYVFSADDFQVFAEKIINEETYDLDAEFEKRKAGKQ